MSLFDDPVLTTGFLTIPALDLVLGTLLVAVGPGASGESTYAQTAAVDAVVCLDSLRREISGDFSVKSSVLSWRPGRRRPAPAVRPARTGAG
ncbi:hypothetical protein AB0F25_29730 [Streptomyces wedmorensis]|uniref:hypothetical protein n=1 Tax=Streptomyces wedmorensis TaxID=43759 RepID=UPI003438FBE5